MNISAYFWVPASSSPMAGPLNGWPSLVNLELRSIDQKQSGPLGARQNPRALECTPSNLSLNHIYHIKSIIDTSDIFTFMSSHIQKSVPMCHYNMRIMYVDITSVILIYIYTHNLYTHISYILCYNKTFVYV